MSLTSQNILDIAEAVNDLVITATNINFSIPSPFHFIDRGDFFNQLSPQATKVLIETTLIKACWIRYLNFEDTAGENQDAREIEDPVKELIYELTVFHESKMDRIDQSIPLDDFNKRVSLSNHEHVTAIMSLCGIFQGTNPVAALLGSFPDAYTIALAQLDDSEHNVGCEFIPGVIGDQTKLECRIRVQLPC